MDKTTYLPTISRLLKYIYILMRVQNLFYVVGGIVHEKLKKQNQTKIHNSRRDSSDNRNNPICDIFI